MIQSQQAYAHLLDADKIIRAQANSVTATNQATELLEKAPLSKMQQIIHYASRKIDRAKETAAHILNKSYLYGKEKLQAPIEYLLGEDPTLYARPLATAAMLIGAAATGVALGYTYRKLYNYYKSFLNPEQAVIASTYADITQKLTVAGNALKSFRKDLTTAIINNDIKTINELEQKKEFIVNEYFNFLSKANQAQAALWIAGIPTPALPKD